MIGKRIRHLREKAGINQRQLAVAASVDPAAVNRIEKGDSDPRYSTMQKIACALKVPLAWLFIEEIGSQAEREDRAG